MKVGYRRVPADHGRIVIRQELMGWTAPAERHRVPDVVVVG